MDSPSSADRLRLLRFVCSFAWADLDVSPAERAYVHELVERLHLSTAEAAEVEGWLQVPPPAEDVDPFDIPMQHRQAVLEAAAEMIKVDGRLDHRELESYMILEALIGALAEEG